MKTTKLVTIMAVLAFAFTSLALHADGSKKKENRIKTLDLTLIQATQNPDLVVAMYQQLEIPLIPPLEVPQALQVDYMGYIVTITGSYEQWVSFFHMQNINAGSESQIINYTS
jgi:hypothetical protein